MLKKTSVLKFYFWRLTTILIAIIITIYFFFHSKSESDQSVPIEIQTNAQLKNNKFLSVNVENNSTKISQKSELSTKKINIFGPSKENLISTNDTLYHDNESNPSITQNINFNETYNDYSEDLSGINTQFVENGKMFISNIHSLKNLSTGDEITISIAGNQLSGIVQKNMPSPSIPTNSYVKVKFGGAGKYMTAYYNEKSIVKGKIYLDTGSFIYESNVNVGFLLPLNEYKKLNNANYSD